MIQYGLRINILLWLVFLSGQSTGACTRGSWVQFPVKGAYLGCRFDPQSRFRCVWQATNLYFSPSLPPSLPPSVLPPFFPFLPPFPHYLLPLPLPSTFSKNQWKKYLQVRCNNRKELNSCLETLNWAFLMKVSSWILEC